MEFHYTPEALQYMDRKRRHIIAVEVAASNHSDIDITEIYIRLVTEKFGVYLRDQKRYREIKTEAGTVLLPPYHLEYAPVITFEVKKFLCFSFLSQKGITL
ncbi:MAG: hypothetical protein K6G83_02585 [Lachnospiraceae bacterium]|nr:hypothetical protein [Lachnospiraceae bacterium]